VIAADAPPPTRHAADELQRFLREITGATLPIVEDTAPPAQQEIIVGASARIEQLGVRFDLAPLGTDGYVLTASGPHLVIVGGEPRGTLYGVYGLLHDHLGCRWFTRDVSRIPESSRLALPAPHETRVPALTYRNFMLDGVMDPDWCARNHLNGMDTQATARHGGKLTHWQYGHSFDSLVPAAKYYDAHPEYFALLGGERIRENAQLCCTSEAAIRLLADNLRRQIERDRAAQQEPDGPRAPDYYYLAQNDWGNCCTCPACAALAESEGARSAPIIHLCNRVAEQLEGDFPRASFITIAYRFSRRAPRSMTVHPNVIVQLCGIECCQSHPHAACDLPEDRQFIRDLEEWRRAAKRVWIWDYVANLRRPFPTGPGVHVVSENLRHYIRHGVSGVFMQDVGDRDFAGLRGYVMARALWDEGFDYEAAAAEFMETVYGPAASPLLDFLKLVREAVDGGNAHVYYTGGACPPFFSDALIEKADALWDEAEAAASDDARLLAHVREERMHFRSCKVQHAVRTSALSACRVEGSAYVFDRPAEVQQDAAALRAHLKRRGENAADQDYCLDAEPVTLDNGQLCLDLLARLGGRLVGCRHAASGHNFCHLTPPSGTEFPLTSGYQERWLGGNESREDTARRAVSWSQPGAKGEGAAGILAAPGWLEHPIYTERYIGLAPDELLFSIETLIRNRATSDKTAAIRTVLPLYLGALKDVTLIAPGAGDAQPRPILDGERSFDAAQSAPGIVLANRTLGLGLRIIAEGNAMERAFFELDEQTARIAFTVETKDVMLMPACLLRLREEFTVLTKESL